MMQFNFRGLGFWLFWGAVGGFYELGMVLTHHVQQTLSYQVWSLVSLLPGWTAGPLFIAFVLSQVVLAWHFFIQDHS